MRPYRLLLAVSLTIIVPLIAKADPQCADDKPCANDLVCQDGQCVAREGVVSVESPTSSAETVSDAPDEARTEPKEGTLHSSETSGQTKEGTSLPTHPEEPTPTAPAPSPSTESTQAAIPGANVAHPRTKEEASSSASGKKKMRKQTPWTKKNWLSCIEYG